MKANGTQEKNDVNPEKAETPHEEFILELMSGKSVHDYPNYGSGDIQEKRKKIISSALEGRENKKIRPCSRASKKNDLDDLKTRSKIFARILREIGCKDGAPICCIMRNSIDFFTALGGIKYAGCKALPVDPSQPINQIQSIIFESKTEWLIVDRSAKPLLGTEILGDDSLNVAWMDSAEMIPENCFPEFARDNIDHISMYPVFPEPDKSEPAITFHAFDKNKLKKNIFTHGDIKKVISSILETINIYSDSKIAGLMSCNSPAVLLEVMCLFHCKAPLFLFDSYQRNYGSFFIRKINRLKITHLLLEAETVKSLLPQILSVDIVSSNVDRMVLWGEKLSEKMVNGLRTIFPNAMINIVSTDSDKNLSIHTANQYASRLVHSS